MSKSDYRLNRRQFLHGLTMTAGSVTLLSPWQNLLASADSRTLSFYHTHTGERLKLSYFEDGQYHADALDEFNHFLRDHRTGEVYSMDLQLIDILSAIRNVTESQGTFEIISAYRSPKTNKALRQQGGGVAKRSLHMQGRALDIRLTDVRTADLRKAALAMKSGGVGYYPKSNFIHLDNGRVRFW